MGVASGWHGGCVHGSGAHGCCRQSEDNTIGLVGGTSVDNSGNKSTGGVAVVVVVVVVVVSSGGITYGMMVVEVVVFG